MAFRAASGSKGISKRNLALSRAGHHANRGGAATTVYQETQDLVATQEFPGHADPKTAEMYIGTGLGMQKKAQAPPREGVRRVKSPRYRNRANFDFFYVISIVFASWPFDKLESCTTLFVRNFLEYVGAPGFSYGWPA